jgi:formate dehydrogenase major subunit
MIDTNVSIQINGKAMIGKPGQTILEAANQEKVFIPQICYNPQLGAIQTCDTCLVEVNGELVRSCATLVQPGMHIATESALAKEAQLEAMSRVLKNHELYCTVCDNNNGNCIVHNTTELLEMDHQKYEFKP